MKKAYLIHGTSTRDDDWFPWLEKAARPAIELDHLWLPDPFARNRQHGIKQLMIKSRLKMGLRWSHIVWAA